MFQIIQRGPDDLIHIVVPVVTQSAAEVYVGFGFSQIFVPGVKCAVFGVIDRIVRLHAWLPFGGILPADHSRGLGAKLKVLVLNNPGVGNFKTSVVSFNGKTAKLRS